MLFKRLFWASCLSMAFLQASSGIFLDDGCSSPILTPPISSVDNRVRNDRLKEKVKDTVSLLLSISDKERTFENFLLPWYSFKSKMFYASYGTQNFELLEAILQEVDPYGFFSSTIKDFSERLSVDDSLNVYQKHVIYKIQSKWNNEQDFFFFKENNRLIKCVDRDLVKNDEILVLNCTCKSNDQILFDEVIAGIVGASADIVCIHDIDHEIFYRLYEKLREFYGYFCLEEGKNDHRGAIIASKYCLDNDDHSFIDENGVFFEVHVSDSDGKIGCILMARPNREPSSEALATITEGVIDKIQIEFSCFPVPTLLCGNFFQSNLPSDTFGKLLNEYFQNNDGENKTVCNLILRLDPLFSQKTDCVPFALDQEGLLSTIFTHSINTYSKYDVGKYVLKSHGSASVSAGGDSGGGSYAEGSVAVSGNGWSAEAYGGVSRDSSGHTSSSAGGSVSVDF